MYSFLICKKMYFLYVIRQKERKSFFLLQMKMEKLPHSK